MFRNQLIILPVLTALAFAGSAQAEVIIRTNPDGISEVQTGNVQVSAGAVSMRRNARIRKKNRFRYSTQVAPRSYYPVVNPDRGDYDADYGQTTSRSTSRSSSVVNGRTHRSTQTTTIQENGRTVIQSNTTD
jgi:hypothetical protein